MKTLIMLGGPMGVGKTSICRELQKLLPANVFLDGDWCWDMRPFAVTDETKKMVIENIVFLLNSFLKCSQYQHILFCWVMDEQEILDSILSRLSLDNCRVFHCSLLCSERELQERLQSDIKAGKRTPDVIERSLQKLPKYHSLSGETLDTGGLSPREAAEKIAQMLGIFVL